MARGPRVDFPSSVGQVGWVDWRTLVQARSGTGGWKTIRPIEKVRRTVSVGFTKSFPTRLLPVKGPKGQAEIRLISRLDWFDQGDDHVGPGPSRGPLFTAGTGSTTTSCIPT